MGEWREFSAGIEISDWVTGEEKEINKQKGGAGAEEAESITRSLMLGLLWWAGVGNNKKGREKGSPVQKRLELEAAKGIKEGFFISLKQTETEQTTQKAT